MGIKEIGKIFKNRDDKQNGYLERKFLNLWH